MGNKKKSKSLTIVLAGLVCLATTFFAACGKGETHADVRPPASVTVVPAVAKDVPVYLDQVGKCTAREVVSIQPQVSGRITSINFTDGADVKKGDLLFTIDSKPFEVALQQAQANLAKDNALKKQSEANLVKDKAQAKWGEVQAARYKGLSDQGVVSKEEYEQMRTNADTINATVEADQAAVKSAEQNLKVDEAAIDAAKVQLAYCSIHSPIDGRAGQRLVDIGNVVNAGFGSTTSMLTIQRLDPIYADFSINQSDLSAVQRNMKQGTLKADITIPDEPDQTFTGDLTFLDNAVQDATGTVKLRATIANPGRKLWPGRFVRVRLVLSNIPDAVLIPASAPQQSATGPFVYVVNSESKAELRNITLGQQQGDLVVVESGVKAGDRVVVSGQIAIQPGGPVQIQAPPAAAPAATGVKQ
jgi:multidrug efflux system membrane fusion protein